MTMKNFLNILFFSSFCLWLVACSGGDKKTAAKPEVTPQTVDKRDYIYSQEINLIVSGAVFRVSSVFPDDNNGKGALTNAKRSYTQRCGELQQELANQLGDKLVSFDCGTAKNISTRNDRVQFQSSARLKVKMTAYYKVVTNIKLKSAVIKVDDFQFSDSKWQDARAAARSSFDDVCHQFSEDNLNKYNDKLILADCGVTEEVSNLRTIQYTSTPTLYVMAEATQIQACANGKKVGETWWEAVKNKPLQIPRQCDFGGSVTLVYENLQFKTCTSDLKVARTDVHNRKGDYIKTIGTCAQAQTAQSCGSHASGTTWSRLDSNNPIVEPVNCRFGGDQANVFENVTVWSCNDGEKIPMDNQKGQFLYTSGACYEPNNCGNHNPNDLWFESTGTTTFEFALCQNGTQKFQVFDQQVQFRCKNGSPVRTGVTKKGNSLDISNCQTGAPPENDQVQLDDTTSGIGVQPDGTDLTLTTPDDGSGTVGIAPVKPHIHH